MRYITPPGNANTTSLDIVMDIHIEKCVKEETKQQRGNKSGPRVHLLTLQQKMAQGEAWKRFFSNDDNKNNLISVFVEFVKSPTF